jgi:hypothetical protein
MLKALKNLTKKPPDTYPDYCYIKFTTTIAIKHRPTRKKASILGGFCVGDYFVDPFPVPLAICWPNCRSLKPLPRGGFTTKTYQTLVIMGSSGKILIEF